MNHFQQKAIEMKYQGYTYKEIADAMGNKVSWHTIESWFRHGGMLDFDYHHYVARVLEKRIDEAREDIKKSAAIGGELLDELLKQSMQSGDLHLAFKIVVKQLALAGIVEPKYNQLPNDEKHYETVEQLVADLEAAGIDPLTGLTIRAKQLLEEGKIPS